VRRSLKGRFGTPDAEPRLRIICETIGPGKAALLRLIAETESISEAARHMKMSYKRAWELIEAMNGCFREPLVVSISGGSRGGGSQLSPAGKQVLKLYESVYAKCLKVNAPALRRLHRFLNVRAPARRAAR